MTVGNAIYTFSAADDKRGSARKRAARGHELTVENRSACIRGHRKAPVPNFVGMGRLS